MSSVRAAVVLVRDGHLALIRRRRAGNEYWLFPGGGVEPGESAADAAVREAKEELGLDVRIDRLIATVRFGERSQLYFAAAVTGGTFGSGCGEELAFEKASAYGGYEPQWVPVAALGTIDVRPRALARLAADSVESWPAMPVELVEGA